MRIDYEGGQAGPPFLVVSCPGWGCGGYVNAPPGFPPAEDCWREFQKRCPQARACPMPCAAAPPPPPPPPPPEPPLPDTSSARPPTPPNRVPCVDCRDCCLAGAPLTSLFRHCFTETCWMFCDDCDGLPEPQFSSCVLTAVLNGACCCIERLPPNPSMNPSFLLVASHICYILGQFDFFGNERLRELCRSLRYLRPNQIGMLKEMCTIAGLGCLGRGGPRFPVRP